MYTNIQIHPLASSTQEKRFLLSCNGRYYEAGLPVVELLEELQQKPDTDAAVAAYVGKKAGRYTPEQVMQAIKKFIDPITTAPKAKKRTFLYEKELFPAAAVDRFSDAFSFLFHKAFMVTLFAVMLVLDVWFFLHTDELLVFNVPQLPRTLYRCDRGVEAGAETTTGGQHCRRLFPVHLPDGAARRLLLHGQ